MLLRPAVLASLSMICVIGSSPEPSVGTFKLRGQISSGDEVRHSGQRYLGQLAGSTTIYASRPVCMRHRCGTRRSRIRTCCSAKTLSYPPCSVVCARSRASSAPGARRCLTNMHLDESRREPMRPHPLR